jgi:Short C-terminal domain
MPGLLRGVARTAAIAGTATAVSGRVQRRQAERFASRDAQIISQREQAYEDAAPAEPPPPAADPIAQLKDLAELHANGVLTDEEFAVQKSKILNR